MLLKRRFGPNSVNPFVGLRIGQWRFLFETWNESLPKAAKSEASADAGSQVNPEEFLEVSSSSPRLQVETELEFEEKVSEMESFGEPEDDLGVSPAMQARFRELQHMVESFGERISALHQDNVFLRQQNAHLEASLHKINSTCLDLKEEASNLRERVHVVEAVAATQPGTPNEDSDLLARLEQAMFDPSGEVAALRHDLTGLVNKMESGGGIEFHGFSFACDRDCVQWYRANYGKVALFADAVALLHSINATVVHSAEALKSKEAAKKVDFETELEASIIASQYSSW
jgi:Tfp pilus assembly protein PilN